MMRPLAELRTSSRERVYRSRICVHVADASGRRSGAKPLLESTYAGTRLSAGVTIQLRKSSEPKPQGVTTDADLAFWPARQGTCAQRLLLFVVGRVLGKHEKYRDAPAPMSER